MFFTTQHGGEFMARRRRRRNNRKLLTFSSFAASLTLGWWWLGDGAADQSAIDQTLALGTQRPLTTDRAEVVPEKGPRPNVTEKGSNSSTPLDAGEKQTSPQRVKSLITAGKQALANDDLIAARAHFSEAMANGAEGEDALLLRAELTRIGEETIFSPRVLDGDPHVIRYIIKPGDVLAKIASTYKISSDLIAGINGIANKHMIRAGRGIKVIKGPFRAVIDSKTFTMDVYLDGTFVKHYKVGMGIDGSTPTGEWRVATKLTNPTYYPPRGGKIVAADDSENPLGERWISLDGISGNAVGQLRYGIHGTIEPESIGQNASLGCIRMYNEDVEALYTYLVEKHSTVTIR
jgi:lipoprotein-anchoring transpeptidase ErfK/SrfK